MKYEIISSCWWHHVLKSARWHHRKCPSSSPCRLPPNQHSLCFYAEFSQCRYMQWYLWLCVMTSETDSLYGSILCYSASTNCGVYAMGWSTRQHMTLCGAVCGCALNYSIKWAVVNSVYCAVSVYVCVSVSGLRFYYPVTPKMPPWE